MTAFHSLRTKVVLTFGLLTTMVILVAGVGLWARQTEEDRFTAYLARDAARIELITRVMDAANARAIAARNLVMAGEPAGRDAEHAEVVRQHAAVGQGLRALGQALAADAGALEDERKAYQAVMAVEAQYAPVALSVAELAMSSRAADARTMIERECTPLLKQLVQAAGHYAELKRDEARQHVLDGQAAAARIEGLLVGAGALATLMAVACAWVLLRAILLPLKDAVSLADRVAAGDLTSGVTAHAQDEIGQLVRALGRMNAALVGIVASVRHCSDGIATGSSEIAASSQDLSDRTETQASSLQETAASMEQLRTTVAHNADAARSALALSHAASAAAREGDAVIDRVVQTMAGIEQSSGRIGEIIGVIDGIAFQTNILALNAAVEAARAGDQGRGFAVVASEVRALAQRCAQSARDIKVLIEASVAQVQAGTSQVSQARASMQDIVTKVTRVATLSEDISVATQQQTTGIAQISDVVSTLDSATQQNAALVEQSAAAAESLRSQARQLADAVARFKVHQPDAVVAG